MGVFTTSALAVATLHAHNATARDTADADDPPLLDSAIRTIATCGQAVEDRLTYLRRFMYMKAFTAGEERAAERLIYSRLFDTTAAKRSNNGVDGHHPQHPEGQTARERATKDKADKNKDKDKIKIKGKPQPNNPAKKTTPPQAEEQE
eukprot:jgi/Tetstr1/433108/TSEL_022440.t1